MTVQQSIKTYLAGRAKVFLIKAKEAHGNDEAEFNKNMAVADELHKSAWDLCQIVGKPNEQL